jgi:type IV secretory pathway protease TraF
MKTDALIATTACLVLVVFAMGLRWIGFTGALTDSEPPGLYREVPGPIVRGQMVELRRLMKHVVAVGGDTVTVTAEGTFVDGKLWPHSAPIAGRYQHYPFGTYKLAAGQYWILGQNPTSWDSRYLGPVPYDLLNSRIVPIFTISNGYAPGTKPWSTQEVDHR